MHHGRALRDQPTNETRPPRPPATIALDVTQERFPAFDRPRCGAPDRLHQAPGRNGSCLFSYSCFGTSRHEMPARFLVPSSD